jgi:hypothetical protein
MSKAKVTSDTGESALRQVLARGWRGSFPYGDCPDANPKVPKSDADCTVFDSAGETAFIKSMRLVCPVAPTMRALVIPPSVTNTDVLSFDLHLGGAVHLMISGKASRTFSGCAKEITHDHDGTGSAGTDPPDYLSSFAVGTLGVGVTLAFDGSATTVDKGAQIDANSTCAFTKEHEFRGCAFIKDGKACGERSDTNQAAIYKRLTGDHELVEWNWNANRAVGSGSASGSDH